MCHGWFCLLKGSRKTLIPSNHKDFAIDCTQTILYDSSAPLSTRSQADTKTAFTVHCPPPFLPFFFFLTKHFTWFENLSFDQWSHTSLPLFCVFNFLVQSNFPCVFCFDAISSLEQFRLVLQNVSESAWMHVHGRIQVKQF